MDIQYLLWLQGLREAAGPGVEQFFVAVSAVAVSALFMIVPCIIYWCLDKRTGVFVVFCFAAGNMLNQLVKNTVCWYRPWVRDAAIVPAEGALEGATGYSFPSGHTAAAGTVLGAIGWSYRKRWPALLVACIALVLLVAFSRNFLGVHTPQDVLVGLAESAIVIALAGPLLHWVDAGANRDAAVLAAGLALCAAFLAYCALKPYPVDYAAGQLLVDPAEMVVDCYKSAGMVAGAVLGWFCERRLVRFETGCSRTEAFFRAVVGTILTLVAYVLLGGALVSAFGPTWGGLGKNLLALLTAVFLAPLAFEAAGKRLFRRELSASGASLPAE